MALNQTKIKSEKKADTRKVFNPFPGLRPYGINEGHLFFGREGQNEDILSYLAENRFVGITGSSGSGKSSLVYCGLIPLLYGGFIPDAGSDWKIVSLTPGSSPVENLSAAIVSVASQNISEEDELIDRSITSTILRRSSFGLANAIKQLKLIENSSLLLVIDQFEELFRFRSGRKELSVFNETESFIKLLLNAVNHSSLPIYIVITMRSDYLGECSRFQELTKMLNKSNYLIPRMKRDDFRLAITGPIAVGGAKIEPSLVQQLLNEMRDNPDQLPILQHALMRTYDYWMRQNNFDRPINFADYRAIGKMDAALSQHADEAFGELDDNGKRIGEVMFKTLTEKGTDNKGTRHPSKVSTIAEIARVKVDEVIRVIDKFRSDGRFFLTPPQEVTINSDSIIDLSHESIMRIWARLIKWVDDEAEAVKMYIRLSEASAQYQLGKTSLLRPPELQLATAWKDKQQPTLTWAHKYNPAFERAMVYLDTSQKEYERELRTRTKQQKRRLRKYRFFFLILAAAVVVSLSFAVWTRDLMMKSEEQKVEMETQMLLAEERVREIDEQRIIAEDALISAELQRIMAERETETSVEQRRQAEENAREAIRLQTIAHSDLAQLDEERQEALQTAEEAQRLSQLASERAAEVLKRRMLSIAQSMTVKSLNITNDKDLKGLIAYQGYLFNQRYDGSAYTPELFMSLYSASNMLQGTGHNVLSGHRDAVKSVAFAPRSNVFYSTGSDGRILRWNLDASPKSPSTIISNNLVNEVILVSNDGRWLACGTDGLGVQLFDLTSSGYTPRIFNGHDGKIRSLAFSPDNRHLYSIGLDNTILEWDMNTGNSRVVVNHSSRINKISISPNGNYIAGATRNGEVILWNRNANFNETVLYSDAANTIFSVAFSNDGTLLATGDVRGNIRLWNVRTGNLTRILSGHNARVYDLKFSPDGEFLGSVSLDGTVRLWYRKDLSLNPLVFEDNQGFVFAIDFNHDGQWFVTGSTEESRLVYRSSRISTIVNGFCNWLSRNMTREEWRSHVAEDVEYERTCQNL